LFEFYFHECLKWSMDRMCHKQAVDLEKRIKKLLLIFIAKRKVVVLLFMNFGPPFQKKKTLDHKIPRLI